MAGFRLLNYAGAKGEPRSGIAVGDEVLDLATAVVEWEKATGKRAGFSPTTTLHVLEKWDTAVPVLTAIAGGEGAAPRRKLADVRLLAPILYPAAIFNAIANYTDHQKEMSDTQSALEKEKVEPYIFLKSGAHCVISPGDDIRLPHTSQKVDWEAELAVVIGRYARNLTKENALSCVAGYTIFNDLSARDNSVPKGRRQNIDWFAHKNFDGAGPLGPWIVPAADIPDPHDVSIELWINDEKMQDSNSGFLFFNINELIEYLTARLTLRPGDVIATGTPSGVGRPRGIFLKPGDTVTIELGSGLGRLQNPVVQGE